MEETRTGGGKEFVFSVIWAVILLFIGKLIIAALTNYKLIGMLITILMFCVLGFFVLTRYSAIYTFTLKNDRMTAVRKIGHRYKEVVFSISQVKFVSAHRPAKTPKTVYNMKTKVFSQKNIWYIVYEKNRTDNMLVCEISKQMADKIRSRVKNSNLAE